MLRYSCKVSCLEQSGSFETQGRPSLFSLLAELKACSSNRDLDRGRVLHAALLDWGYDTNTYAANALISMYVNCGSMGDARSVFDAMQQPDVASWTVVVGGYVENGEGQVALELYGYMHSEKCLPNARTFLSVLKACKDLLPGAGALEKVQAVHCQAECFGCSSNGFVANTLVDAYASCGSMLHARRCFDELHLDTDVVSWNALLLGYAENGEEEVALELFATMRCLPNARTFVAALKACTGAALRAEVNLKCNALDLGCAIHAQAVRIGQFNTFVANTLIDLYGTCKCPDRARMVFESMESLTTVSWTALIMGYAENGQGSLAVDLFACMNAQGFSPDARTMIAALRACAALAEEVGQEVVSLARGIHFQTVECSCDFDPYVATTLIDLYCKCGKVYDARRVFDCSSRGNVATWNALMFGCADQREGMLTLDLLACMQSEGCVPDDLTFVATLKTCAPETPESVLALHSQAARLGYDVSICLTNSLLSTYSGAGALAYACRTFNDMRDRTAVSWTALVEGCVENGEALLALQTFARMHRSCAPDARTVVAALRACAVLGNVEQGTAIHCYAAAAGDWCTSDAYVIGSLVACYAKCNSMVNAQRVFDVGPPGNIVCCNTLLFGYAENGEGHRALRTFACLTYHGSKPDALTFIAGMKAISGMNQEFDSNELLSLARAVHTNCALWDTNSNLQSNLIDLYVKVGSLMEAQRFFDGLDHPHVASWTSLMLGYADSGQSDAALSLFFRMQTQDFQPDALAFAAALKVCGNLVALQHGREIHDEVQRRNLENDQLVASALVDFYAKCGYMREAQQVFNSLPASKKNLVTWTTLMSGYSRQGDNLRVLDLYETLTTTGLTPDGVTFLCVLTSCAHSGKTDKGKDIFKVMSSEFEAEVGLEHYACMVDMLGRAGKLEDAVQVLVSMPARLSRLPTWTSILGSCSKWKDVVLGRLSFEFVIALGEVNDDMVNPAIVLMANIYGSLGMWEEQALCRQGVYQETEGDY